VVGFVILSATKDLAGKMIRFFALLRMTKRKDRMTKRKDRMTNRKRQDDNKKRQDDK